MKFFLHLAFFGSAAWANTPPQLIDITCPESQWINQIEPGAQPRCTQPTATDVQGLGAIAPLIYSPGIFSITQSGVTSNGYLSSTDWNTFNDKSNADYPPTNGGDTNYDIQTGPNVDRFVRSGTTLTSQRTWTLPVCVSGNLGELHSVKNIPTQTFNIVLTANGSDTIDNVSTYTLYPKTAVTVQCSVVGNWDAQ
jgi:hypothetical protein